LKYAVCAAGCQCRLWPHLIIQGRSRCTHTADYSNTFTSMQLAIASRCLMPSV
jgi:hypothetical protein